MKPWEEYQQTEAQSARGPWEDFAPQPATQPAPQRGAYEEVAQESGVLENLAASFGGAMYAPYLGVRQMIGKATPEEVADYQAAMRGLNTTKAGNVGSFLGAVAPVAATAAIPGANTLVGSATIGALSGIAQPVAEGGPGRLEHGAMGAVGGVAGKVAGDKIAGYVANRFSNKSAEMAAKASRRAVIDSTRQQAINAGFKIPPATVNNTLGNRLKESIAGKAATQQAMSLHNVGVVDGLARKAASIPDDMPLTEDMLAQARHALAKPYRDVAALPQKRAVAARSGFTEWEAPVQQVRAFNPADALDNLKQTRAESKLQWQHYARQKTPEALKAARALDETADSIENSLEQYAAENGSSELVKQLRAARTAIAKNHAVDSALIEGSGSIDARVIGKMRQQRKPLTNELKTIGDFARNHPKLVQPEAQIGSPGVSKIAAGLSTLLAGGGGAVAGPAGIAAGALPFAAPWAMQKYLMANAAQKGLFPNYRTSPLLTNTLNNPYTKLLYPGIGVGLLGPGAE